MMRAILAAALALAAASAFAQPATPFIQPLVPAIFSGEVSDHTIVAERVVVALPQLDTEPLLRVTFLDVDAVVVLDRIEPALRGIGWVGHLQGEPGSNFLVSRVGDAAVGTLFRQNGKVYRLFPDAGGRFVIEQFDAARARPEAAPSRFVVPSPPSTHTPCTKDASTSIDVLVVYTADAQAFARGENAIRAAINQAILETNDSFPRSNVHLRLNLVEARLVDYTESGHLADDLAAAIAPSDHQLDDVHALRDGDGADLVFLVVEHFDDGGKSTVMEALAPAFEAKAFAVVPRIYLTGSYTFAHEFGHLLGARHDWFADSTDNAPDHADHGYIRLHPKTRQRGPWRTIMAQPNLCNCAGVDCDRVGYWSNPSIVFPSFDSAVPDDFTGTGEPEPTDDHATLNAAAALVANFRCHQ